MYFTKLIDARPLLILLFERQQLAEIAAVRKRKQFELEINPYGRIIGPRINLIKHLTKRLSLFFFRIVARPCRTLSQAARSKGR